MSNFDQDPSTLDFENARALLGPSKLTTWLEARRQGLVEMLEAAGRDPTIQKLDFARREMGKQRASWAEIERVLLRLPTLDEIAFETSPLRAVISTELGALVHVFTCDRVNYTLSLRGVFSFPSEEIELERQTQFFALDLELPVLLTLEALDHALERYGHGTIGPDESGLPIYSLELVSIAEPAACEPS